MFYSWSDWLTHLNRPELLGLGVAVLILIAMIRDLRERARFTRAARSHWHLNDPQPAGRSHKTTWTRFSSGPRR